MGSSMLVSIIIPFYRNVKYLKECVSNCLNLNYSNYEVIVVSNTSLNLGDRVKVIVVDDVGQASKLDIGIAEASGEVCAFIDDDAFPHKDWFKNAVPYFDDPNIVAVGGPGITPENDGLIQKGSGAIYSSFLGGGPLNFRYVPKKRRYVEDYPTYNLLVRRSALKQVGGFSTRFRSGEDTQLCLKIVKKGKKILYAPDVIVYHHRRPLFVPHLRQVRTYGLHRGYFAKRFPETSARITYMVPFMFFMALILGSVFSVFSHLFRLIFLLVLTCYLLAGFVSGLWLTGSLKIGFLSSVGIPLTHLTYGLGFIEGLMTRKLGEKPSY